MRVPAAAALLLLAASSLPAQEAPPPAPPPLEEVPVGDIVRYLPERAGPRPVGALPLFVEEPDLQPDPGWPMTSEGHSPLADGDELLDALWALLGGREIHPLLRGGSLLVVGAEAPAVRGAVDRIRARRPSDFTATLVLEEAADGGWRTLLGASEPVLPGVPLVFADARDRTFLCDYDVELAQDSQLPDPIVGTQRTGASVSLRILPLPRGDAAVVEAVARISAPLPGERAEPGYAEMAPLDRGAIAAAEAAVVFRAAPGAESVHGWRGRDGRFYRLRLTLLWTPPPADAGSGAVLWSPLFHIQPPHRRFVGHLLKPAGAEADEDEYLDRFGWSREAYGVGFDERVARAADRLGGEAAFVADLTDGGLAVFSRRDAGAVAAGLAAAMDGEYRSSPFEVEVRQSPPGGGGGGAVLLLASGSLVPGVDAFLRSGEARTYIEDWDVEVAQGSWIPDPQLDLLQTGDFLNLRLVDDGTGGIGAVDLDLQMARFEGFEGVDLPILNAMDRSAGSPSGTAAGAPRRTSYRIERPTVAEVRIAGRYALGPDGTVVLRRAAPGFLGGAGEIVVTLKVR